MPEAVDTPLTSLTPDTVLTPTEQTVIPSLEPEDSDTGSLVKPATEASNISAIDIAKEIVHTPTKESIGADLNTVANALINRAARKAQKDYLSTEDKMDLPEGERLLYLINKTSELCANAKDKISYADDPITDVTLSTIELIDPATKEKGHIVGIIEVSPKTEDSPQNLQLEIKTAKGTTITITLTPDELRQQIFKEHAASIIEYMSDSDDSKSILEIYGQQLHDGKMPDKLPDKLADTLENKAGEMGLVMASRAREILEPILHNKDIPITEKDSIIRVLNDIGGRKVIDKDTMTAIADVLFNQRLKLLSSNHNALLDSGEYEKAERLNREMEVCRQVLDKGENSLISRFFTKVEQGDVPEEALAVMNQMLETNNPRGFIQNLISQIQHDPDLSPEEKEEKIAALKSIPFSVGPGIFDTLFAVVLGIGSEVILNGVLAKGSHIAD